MDLGIAGKQALVLGASSGLGLGIAKALAAEGAAVTVAARKGDRLDAALGEVSATAKQAKALAVDLGSPASVDEAVDAIAHLKPAILVGNAGGPPPGSALESDLETWRRFAESLLFSQIRLIRAAVPGMTAAGWGRIVLVGSSGVVVPIPNLVISNSLRAATVAFAKTLAEEVAKAGITVNVVLPGRIATDRVAQLDEAAGRRLGISTEASAEKAMATIPMGRYGSVEEFANAAVFLASARASYITGHLMRVDGGLIRSF